jgi:hypothetical protein
MIPTTFKPFRPIFWAAMFLFIGSGCVRTIQPVLKDEQVVTDNRFLGSWVGENGKASGEVSATDDHKGYKLLYTDEQGKQANLLLRLGKIGDMLIAESTIEDPAPDASDVYKVHLLPLHSFMVVKEGTASRLVLKLMDPEWLAKFIDAHPTELAIVRPSKEDLIISASTDDFQNFLIHHASDDGAFGNDAVFVRPGDPTTRSSADTATAPTGISPAPK